MARNLLPRPRKELGPDSSADDVLDEGLEETFPASDPLAVGKAYRRKLGKEDLLREGERRASAYRKILVAVDDSSAAAKGLREALRLAKAEGARLHILHVVNEYVAFATPLGTPPVDLVPMLREGGERILAKARSAADKTKVPVKTVMREMVGGSVADAIVREARKLDADLIVLGTHGRRGVRRLVLGSDAEQVVRTASAPVLLVRG